jgi:hypothetical protein
MGSAKDIILRPIPRKDADRVVKRVHYSGKVVNNSQLHIGVFYNGKLEGAMQFGPSLDKRKVQGLVQGTLWNGFLELNRMAFSEALPRNSESRAIAVAMRLLRKHAPHVQWVISFADGAQCGHGTIYQASGFVLTKIGKNNQIWAHAGTGLSMSRLTWENADSNTRHRLLGSTYQRGMSLGAGRSSTVSLEAAGWRPLQGFQLRYIYFIDPSARQRLTVPILPFSAIDKAGARMYRGERVGSDTSDTSGVHPE